MEDCRYSIYTILRAENLRCHNEPIPGAECGSKYLEGNYRSVTTATPSPFNVIFSLVSETDAAGSKFVVWSM
jgi:hypothetical protein